MAVKPWIGALKAPTNGKGIILASEVKHFSSQGCQ